MSFASTALALVGMLLLAGCSNHGGSEQTNSVLDVPDASVDLGSGSGALAGVVVDEAIRPVPRAYVSAEGQFNVTTDEQGQFVVKDLAPGLYMFQVTAPGFLPVHTGVEVEGGDAAPVRLLLTHDPRPQPKHQTYHFTGHVDLWLGQKLVEDAAGTSDCTCIFEVVPDGVVRTWVVEANGTYTLENPGLAPHAIAPARGTVAWSVASQEGVKQSGQQNFPFTAHVPGDPYDNSTGPYAIQLTGANWPAGQIDYELYVTAFYVNAAPEGWSFLAGDV